MSIEYVRGSLWWTNLPPTSQRSSVQAGYRPVVIVSSTYGCLSNDVVTVCPITTKLKQLQVNIDINPSQLQKSQVLTNQLLTVPKNSLSRPSGYLTSEEMLEVEKGILISPGIAKPVVDNLKASQEALIQAKKDREEIERLIPQGKEVINKLTELINRACNKPVKPIKSYNKTRERLSGEQIESFIREWEDPYNKKLEVAEAFGFSSYGTAWSFYKTHKNKEGGK